MDLNQPTANPDPSPAPAPSPPSVSRGMFGTGLPITSAFAVAVLLFLAPFIDIKCNEMSLQKVSGIQLATGFKMKSSGNSMFDDAKTETTDTKTSKDSDSKKPNLYAMIALGLGILGLVLSFVKARAALGSAMVTGVLGAAALIGMMIDIKKQIKLDMPKTTGTTTGDDISKEVSDKINISVDFTTWFYIAVIAFLLAAFFCYKRIQATRTA